MLQCRVLVVPSDRKLMAVHRLVLLSFGEKLTVVDNEQQVYFVFDCYAFIYEKIYANTL